MGFCSERLEPRVEQQNVRETGFSIQCALCVSVCAWTAAKEEEGGDGEIRHVLRQLEETI